MALYMGHIITLDPYEKTVTLFRKTKDDVLQEIGENKKIKICEWVQKIKPANIHRCRIVDFTIHKRIHSVDYILNNPEFIIKTN